MKLRIVIGILLAGTLLFGACHGDLDIAQKSQITSTNMWKSESDATSAVNGAYAQFRSAFSTSYVAYGDYRSGLYGGGMMSDVGYDNMAANTIFRDNEGTNWQALYTTINDCNLILKYAPNIPFNSQAVQDEVMANALFLRAYTYFWIGRIWGKAPLLTAGFESDAQDDLFPERAPEADIFAQVESDITQALELMPANVTAQKTASRNSINMLKADYFLWKAKVRSGGQAALQSAQTAINAVLASSGDLSPSFSDVFTNETNPEILFSVNYERNEFVGGYPSMYLIPIQYVDDKNLVENPIKVGSHQQYISITDHYEAFLTADPSDTRINTSFMVYQEGANRFRWINKYYGEWENDTRYFSSDIVIYRLAEALLMKAEVENALGNTSGAIEFLNKVAKRAYGVDNYYPSSLTAVEVDEKIVDETLKEFVAEGKSWWTLVRFGVAFTRIPSLVGRENETNVLLWPVATACITTNPNIEQTEGYN